MGQMSNVKVHFSSESDLWETPLSLYRELDNEFNFLIDIACDSNNCKAKYGIAKDLGMDALDGKKWAWNGEQGTVFCNPPYSRGLQKLFIAEADRQRKLFGIKSVFLIPARTDTKTWHKYIWDKENHCPREGVEVRFLEGRVKFEKDGKPLLDKSGKPQSAPFPSVIVVFNAYSND